jgi:heterodisulfide reductase subunit C
MGEIRPQSGFREEVEAKAGTSLSACFGCHKCAAGCPLSAAFDLRPDQLIRLVQLGARERVLGSATVWLCAGCATCATRCPNGVELPALMDALKQLALAAGIEPPEAGRGVALMQRLFLEDVARRGRVHELGLIGRYRLAAGGLTDDLTLGWQMLRRGKLRLLPPRPVKGLAEVRRLLSEAKQP